MSDEVPRYNDVKRSEELPLYLKKLILGALVLSALIIAGLVTALLFQYYEPIVEAIALIAGAAVACYVVGHIVYYIQLVRKEGDI